MRERPDFWKGADRICWLCVFMAEFAGTDSLESAPVLMSGMASVFTSAQLSLARQAAFNLRHLALNLVTPQAIKHAVAVYNDHHFQRGTAGPYQIDAVTLRFQRRDMLEDSNIARARTFLAEPVPYRRHGHAVADPRQAMSVVVGEDDTSGVRIPIAPISVPLPPRVVHVDRQPAEAITIPISDLEALALEMDERDRQHPHRRPGNWSGRLKRTALMAVRDGVGLEETPDLVLADLKHLLGLPGAGKTTLLVLLSLWLARRRHKTMLVFPSIEVARQYMADLTFHGARVGMLVGQGPTTRRMHADRIADTIAGTSGQGGFAATMEGADSFAANCVLPAFAVGETTAWGFGEAPCERVLQGQDSKGRPRRRLCPLWTACGRNKASRDLVEADIWVGHVISMDTRVPAHAIDDQLRYFELIARSFDVVVFDEADMVQSTLDSHGAAIMSISGAEDSIHRQIQEQIHSRFARGENHSLYDRNIELFSRELAEFGNHNTSLITTVHNIDEKVMKWFKDALLTTSRVIAELLDGFSRRRVARVNDSSSEPEANTGFTRARALTNMWDSAAYEAFYDRTGFDQPRWPHADLCSRVLDMPRGDLEDARNRLTKHFRRYLAETYVERRDTIVKDIVALYLPLCFPGGLTPVGAEDAVRLLVCVTFMILGYQRIVPGTRVLVAEGLIKEPVVDATATPEMRKFIPENILGSLSGVRYTLTDARTTRPGRNVELHYIAFVGAPRMLMHRFHRLLEADGQRGPSVLLTSATSFLEASPAYHVAVGPHYLLKPRVPEHDPARSRYRFKWIPDRENGGNPLRYSGARELGERNLQAMVDALVRGGISKSEVYKAIRNFDVRHGIQRKAALVVNSYAQARAVKRFLDDHHREVGRRTKAIVRFLRDGERAADYVTPSQAEALGDDDTCDIIVFPMTALGRGVNIVFTGGPRERDAAIGTIYFLTRPHPSGDDMQLLQSIAGCASQTFDARTFPADADLASVTRAWRGAKHQTRRLARRLLQEPLMASRLGDELFRPFTANQMVAILQTIGRGMRNGCPVTVYFVDAAWAPRSASGEEDNARGSMLVQMRSVLDECINHEDATLRVIYKELYGAFLEPLRAIEGLQAGPLPTDGPDYPDDGFDDDDGIYEQE